MMADESHFRNKLLRKRNIMEYQIISDGSCDLDIDTLKKYNIHTVPFYVSFDGEKYDKEIQEIEIILLKLKLNMFNFYKKQE